MGGKEEGGEGESFGGSGLHDPTSLCNAVVLFWHGAQSLPPR